MSREPLVECTYGWGHVLRLYQDYLDLNGTCYALSELMYANPVYRSVLGISSIRLELRFREEIIVLRGIVALEKVRTIVAYLNSRCLAAPPPPLYLGTAQAPPMLNSGSVAPRGVLPSSPYTFPFPATAWGSGPVITSYDISPDKFIEPYVAPMTMPMALPEKQQSQIQELLERRLRSLRAERSRREHGFDVERLARRLRKGLLPRVQVPVRLHFDEFAHYSTDAVLSNEPRAGRRGLNLGHALPRRARDQGTLILTNKRLIYVGRKRQIVLGYEQLSQVTRLRGAIAFFARHWNKREIFEMRRPLECTMYLESILQQFQQQSINNELTQPQVMPAYLAPSTAATFAEDAHGGQGEQGGREVQREPETREVRGERRVQEERMEGRGLDISLSPDAETLEVELPPWKKEQLAEIEVPEEFRELVEWTYRAAWRREGKIDD